MAHRDTRDLIGGLVMTALGLAAAWHAGQHYDIGTLSRMGPGYFPVALGLVLAALGVLITVPALFRAGVPIRIDAHALLLVVASVALFGLLLKSVGLIVATLAAALVSSLADRRITWRRRGLVAGGVVLLTWLIFVVGLNMILPVWPWSA